MIDVRGLRVGGLTAPLTSSVLSSDNGHVARRWVESSRRAAGSAVDGLISSAAQSAGLQTKASD